MCIATQTSRWRKLAGGAASPLGNRISGGKILAARTRPTTNRITRALRMAAQSLQQAENELDLHYRRLRAKLGDAAAVTAMAHKLARILQVMITRREAYRPDLHDATGALHRARTLQRLTARAKDPGFQLVPTPASA